MKSPYPVTLENFNSMVVNRNLTGAGANERQHFIRLFVIAYTIAELEIPLVNFLSLPNCKSITEQTWGNTALLQGNIRLTHLIGKAVRRDLVITVQQTQYFSILINGSENTKTNTYERKYMFYIYMGKTPLPNVKLLN